MSENVKRRIYHHFREIITRIVQKFTRIVQKITRIVNDLNDAASKVVIVVKVVIITKITKITKKSFEVTRSLTIER